MGEEAIDQLDGDKDELNKDAPKDEEPGSSPDNAQDGESSGEVEQVDVVLAIDDGSQPATKRPNRGFKKRIDKLNERNVASQQEANHATEALEVEKQKNRLLQLALDQKKELGPVKAPDPNEFDDGVSDPRYIQANNDFILAQVGDTVKKHIPQQEAPQPQVDYGLQMQQTRHYEMADKLGVADYEEIEDKAIEILGKNVVNQLISGNDESHKILYFLGKNPKRAADIADLIKTQPIRGVMELGALGEGLKVIRQKANLNQAPDPDTELAGGSPTKGSSYERKLDELREQASKTGDMKALIAFKKESREKARA